MNRRTFSKWAGLCGLGSLVGNGDFAELRALAPVSEGASWAGQSASANSLHQAARAGKGKRNLWDHYFLGTSYYPEWWEPAEWEIDFREMQELGINTVRMGEFGWAMFEPAPGKFDFAWMDRAIAVANSHGIDVILGTPTAAVPPWLYQLHPDVLSGNDSGIYTYGGRKGYCTSSQNYLQACARIVTALAEHYGRHPGVIGWQLDNEPGFPYQSYDPVSERAFQIWLEKRYGTLDTLNRTWNGAFFSNKYSDWSQIRFPRNSAEGGWQPAISLDYRRFFSDSFLNHLRRQAAILHEKSDNQLIFTNWPSTTWSVDVRAAATEFLDGTAWDNYVIAPGLSDFQRQYIAGFNHDFSRCAGPNQRFLCAEQTAYVPPIADTKGLRLQAYVNLAHGSHGHLYFEWRRPLAGNEQYRPSFIKGFDGAINPAKPVFEQIGREFKHFGPRLAGATTRSDVALLYDFTNEWGQGYGFPGNSNAHYDGEAYHYYNGLKVLQRNIDIVPLSADLSQYKLAVAPNLRLVDDATAQRLKAFVAAGGILVLNFRAGTQNVDCSMRRALPPGIFTEIAGVTAESKLDLIDYGGLAERLAKEPETALGISFSGEDAIFQPHTILESLVLHGAEPLATFRGGRMTGKPAITRHRYQQGWVFYVGTDSTEDRFHETLARLVGATGNLSSLISAPYGVEVTSREDTDTVFYFLLNLTEAATAEIQLPHPMDDLIAGQAGVTKLSLGPLEVAVLTSPKR